MRFSVGLIEWLFEWAEGFAGIVGVFILLLFLGAGIFFVGIFMILVPGALVEVFTGTHRSRQNGATVHPCQPDRI